MKFLTAALVIIAVLVLFFSRLYLQIFALLNFQTFRQMNIGDGILLIFFPEFIPIKHIKNAFLSSDNKLIKKIQRYLDFALFYRYFIISIFIGVSIIAFIFAPKH